MSLLLILSVLAFPVLVVTAAARDIASYTIPNWISLALVATFVPAAGVALAAGAPLPDLLLCVGVGAAALVACIVLFTLGWIGGGDAKLIASSALWLGWSALTPFLFWTALSGGIISAVLIIVRRRPVEAGTTPRLLTKGEPVPYGLAIAAGALAAFPQSVLGALAFG